WDKTILVNRNPNIHKLVLKTRSGNILRFHASGYKGDIRSNFPWSFSRCLLCRGWLVSLRVLSRLGSHRCLSSRKSLRWDEHLAQSQIFAVGRGTTVPQPQESTYISGAN